MRVLFLANVVYNGTVHPLGTIATLEDRKEALKLIAQGVAQEAAEPVDIEPPAPVKSRRKANDGQAS